MGVGLSKAKMASKVRVMLFFFYYCSDNTAHPHGNAVNCSLEDLTSVCASFSSLTTCFAVHFQMLAIEFGDGRIDVFIYSCCCSSQLLVPLNSVK